MKENETNYGNFAEPKVDIGSKRGESVVLYAITALEMEKRRSRGLERKIKKLKQKILDLQAKNLLNK